MTVELIVAIGQHIVVPVCMVVGVVLVTYFLCKE